MFVTNTFSHTPQDNSLRCMVEGQCKIHGGGSCFSSYQVHIGCGSYSFVEWILSERRSQHEMDCSPYV